MDHLMVSVKLAHGDAPKLGRGRWSLKEHIIRDKRFRAFVNMEGSKAFETMKHTTRTSDNNSQAIYLTWKNAVVEMAKLRDKMIVLKYIRDIKNLETKP